MRGHLDGNGNPRPGPKFEYKLRWFERLSPTLAGRLTGAGVDVHVRGWEKTSDHAPVWIELSGAPTA